MHSRTRLLAILALFLGMTACSSAPQPVASNPPITSSTQSSIPDSEIGKAHGTGTLHTFAESPQYGYSEKLPIMVGGGFGDGRKNTYRFLNSVLGPDGQPVAYRRIGTCCKFKTPNSPFDGTALLEVYEITFEGATEPRRLYFNWYDSGEVLIPQGLSALQ